MAIDFKFKIISPTDYNLILSLEVKGYAMNYIFKKVKRKISKKLKKPLEGDLSVIEEMEIPDDMKATFLPIIYKGIKKQVNDVAARVRADNDIIIQNYAVENAKYINKTKVWLVEIKVIGQWSK